MKRAGNSHDSLGAVDSFVSHHTHFNGPAPYSRAIMSPLVQAVVTALLSSSSVMALSVRPTRTTSSIKEKRTDISHDQVVGFNTAYPNTTEGELMALYWPFLDIVDGCESYPAVDEQGNTSGGLSPTGTASGDCSDSTGQVYARAEAYGDYYAIMYSWFMPKDEPNEVESWFGSGHRYDWENVVLVLSEESLDASVVGVAASYHGDYVACVGSDCDEYLNGSNLLIRYYSAYDVLDHSLGFTSTVGSQQPLIAWGNLTTAAQEGLTDKDWGGKTTETLANWYASPSD
jgi:hypothetical protein